MHEDGKVKKLKKVKKDGKVKKPEKSRLLLEEGPSYLCDIDNVVLKSAWYIKYTDNIYKFILNSEIVDQNSYKHKFWDTTEKKLGIVKSMRHILNFLEKVLILKEKK